MSSFFFFLLLLEKTKSDFFYAYCQHYYPPRISSSCPLRGYVRWCPRIVNFFSESSMPCTTILRTPEGGKKMICVGVGGYRYKGGNVSLVILFKVKN